MFSALYIKKCIKGRGEVEYLREFHYVPDGYSEIPLKFPFKEGDYFHYEATMKEDEVKEVYKVEGDFLYAINEYNPYRIQESVWIPTADQLRLGLKNIVFSLGDTSDWNVEQILDTYMSRHEGRKWDEEKGEWVKIEE
jgi:hypothetical protein